MKTKFLLMIMTLAIIGSSSFSQDSGGMLCGPEPKDAKPLWILRFEIIDKYSHTPISYAGIKISGAPGEHEMYWKADSTGIAVLIVSDHRCIPSEGTFEITANEYHYYIAKLNRYMLEEEEQERRIYLEGHTHQWVDQDVLPGIEELINKIRERRYRVGVKEIPSGFGFNWPNYAPACFEYKIELERMRGISHYPTKRDELSDRNQQSSRPTQGSEVVVYTFTAGRLLSKDYLDEICKGQCRSKGYVYSRCEFSRINRGTYIVYEYKCLGHKKQ